MGDRLLTANTYANCAKIVSDLHAGPADFGRWQNFDPIIVDLFSYDQGIIEARKKQIEETEWARVQHLGERYIADNPGYVRDGCPLYSMIPGTPAHLLKELVSEGVPPRFSVTPGALARFREILSGAGSSFDDSGVLLDTNSIHPEIHEHQMDFRSKKELLADEYHQICVDSCSFAIPRDKSHAFDNVILGFDSSRGGFVFNRIR